MVWNTENLAFYEMFCMQHTLLKAKIIFLKSEMGWKESKMQLEELKGGQSILEICQT